MKQRIATWAATITALACASPLRAHHSISMFEISAPIWVKGTVVRYEAGDVIEVCGFALKEEYSRPSADTDDARPRFVHGHVLVMPDGHMQSWGPYGKLDNCIRPDDQAQSWLDFLSADPLARGLWCGIQTYVGASIASKTS